MADLDALIVGQGLAGSLLAFELMRRGRRILVVDDGHRTSSSVAAAGLINPVTGQRLVKPAGVEQWLEAAERLYGELGELFGQRFLVPREMWRLVRSEQEREAWERRQADPDYAPFLGHFIAPESEPLNAPLGSFRQFRTAYLRVGPLLESLRSWLEGQSAYCSGVFEHSDLRLREGSVRWEGITARQVIFCEGYRMQSNPWFGALPLQPAKGEILTLEGAGWPDPIVNGGRWLLPIGNGRCKVGATYDWKKLDQQPTVEAREALLASVPTLVRSSSSPVVIEQQAGVRPGTRDKAPFLGFAPQHPQLALFNGFGSKGSLMIPWHACLFSEVIEGNTPLPQSVDIARFAQSKLAGAL